MSVTGNTYRALWINPGAGVYLDKQSIYARNLEVPSGLGVGTARVIAHAYGVFASDGRKLGLRKKTLDLLAAPAIPPTRGFYDECLKVEGVQFSLGFMKPSAVWAFGSPSSFGAPGAGGALGFADPAAGIGYAYVTSQMGTHLTGDPRDVALRDALYSVMPKCWNGQRAILEVFMGSSEGEGLVQLTSTHAPSEAIPEGAFTNPDPAERSAFMRLFYRNRRPTLLGHWNSQFFCWWARVGLPPRFLVALEVRDRVSGRMRADAVVVSTVADQQYIVSMFGNISDWVRNLAAAHGDAVISHGGSVSVHLVLVPPQERAPILREFVRIASSGRKHFPLPVGAPLADFATIAAQHPVYRIERPDNISK